MIHKQELSGTSHLLPSNAKILTAQYQGSQLYFWYYFDPKLQKSENPCLDIETYHFKIVGTGWGDDLTGYTYLATVQEAFYVWHIFYDKRDLL
jgi:hypothetical protein